MNISPSHRVSTVKTYYFAKKLAEIEKLRKGGHKVINLGIGSPDLYPPQVAIDSLVSALSEPTAHKYQSYAGIPALRMAFQQYYKAQFDVSINWEENILPLIGSKEGIMHISMAYIDHGDLVLVPNPGYPTYRSATLLCGGVPIDYDLTSSNNWLPDIDKLLKQDLSKVKLMWINYPHMPTGSNAQLSDFNSLIDFCKNHQILLCHDNPYSHILNENPLSIFNVDGALENCLELISLSKSFNMAGWRVGAVIGQPNYIQNILRFKSNMDSGQFRPIQLAAAQVLKLNDQWFQNLNNIYKKRKIIGQQIMDELDCSYDNKSSGMFIWAKSNKKKNIEQWIDKLIYEAGVFITPGFIFGSNGADYIRLSLCADEETLKNALQKLRAHNRSFV